MEFVEPSLWEVDDATARRNLMNHLPGLLSDFIDSSGTILDSDFLVPGDSSSLTRLIANS